MLREFIRKELQQRSSRAELFCPGELNITPGPFKYYNGDLSYVMSYKRDLVVEVCDELKIAIVFTHSLHYATIPLCDFLKKSFSLHVPEGLSEEKPHLIGKQGKNLSNLIKKINYFKKDLTNEHLSVLIGPKGLNYLRHLQIPMTERVNVI